MPKFKKVGRSKSPLAHQLPIMAENLSKKLDRSAKITIGIWHHKPAGYDPDYQISLVPGFEKACTQYSFKTWEPLLDQYFYLMSRP